MPGLWVQAKQRVRKQAVLPAKLERHTHAYKCTSFTEELLKFHFDVSNDCPEIHPPMFCSTEVPIGVKEKDCSTKGEAPIQVLTEAV